MSGDRSLQLRAQEIINAHPDGMTVRDAMKQAILERYADNPERMADAFATVAAGGMSQLRKRTYELPDDEGLFQIPSWIGIRTEDGDMLVQREAATLGQAAQWAREGLQHHSVQRVRFKRAADQLEQLKDEKRELPWWNARRLLAAIETTDEVGDGAE